MARSKYWNFNLTEEDHKTILTHQKGVCALCGHSLSEQGKPLRLAVDHNHADGLIRGLLCFRCNVMVGALTIVLVEKILEYLKNPPATQALGAPRFGLPGRVGTKKQRKLYKKMLKAGIYDRNQPSTDVSLRSTESDGDERVVPLRDRVAPDSQEIKITQ